MKIGYWLGNVNINAGGIEPYAWRILEVLLLNSQKYDIEIRILCNSQLQERCLKLINKYNAKAKISLIPYNYNSLQRVGSILGIILAKVFKKVNINSQFPLILNPLYRWFFSLDINLLHIPYQISPIYDLPYCFIVTMHDVQELHFPEFFTPDERAWRANNYWKSLKYSNSVIVLNKYIKQDLIKYFRLPESKINVCPLPSNQSKLVSPTIEELEI